MRKIIELTPEWVLEKLPDTSYADGEGKISLCTGSLTNADFIELALDTLNISYETYDFVDDGDELVFGFDLRIEDIKEECPTLHKRMGCIHKNLLKN